MQEVSHNPEQLRPAFLALAAAPETLTAVKLWGALALEERREALARILTCNCISPRTYSQLAAALKIRVQTLKSRPIPQAAASLERSGLSPSIIQVALGHFITGPLQAPLDEFYSLIEVSPNTEGTIPLRTKTRADPERVVMAATMTMAHHPPEDALLVLLGVYVQEPGLRPMLGCV